MIMKRLLFAVWFLSILSTASFAEEVCLKPEGCKLYDGMCIGCIIVENEPKQIESKLPVIIVKEVIKEVIKEVEVFNDLASLTYSIGRLPEGEYRMKTLVMNEGRVIYWTLPLKMTLQSITGNVYVVKFSGKGKVLDNNIDCTKPFVLTFTLDHNNKQINSSVLDGGSCPNIHTTDQNVVWKTNERGLKKIKTYSIGGTCDVGPCDWITTKTNSYFYERI